MKTGPFFYNNGNALSISNVGILVHLRNRLSVLQVVSQDLKTQMPFNLKLSSLLHSTCARGKISRFVLLTMTECACIVKRYEYFVYQLYMVLLTPAIKPRKNEITVHFLEGFGIILIRKKIR